MLKCEYSVRGAEKIKRDEKDAYDEIISDISHYVDGKILKKIKEYYK